MRYWHNMIGLSDRGSEIAFRVRQVSRIVGHGDVVVEELLCGIEAGPSAYNRIIHTCFESVKVHTIIAKFVLVPFARLVGLVVDVANVGMVKLVFNHFLKSACIRFRLLV